MRNLFVFLSLSFLTILTACGGGINTSSQEATQQSDTTTTQTYDNADVMPPTPAKPSCAIAGEILEENESWNREHGLIITILADDETKDPDLGESHRILEVYDANTCNRIDRQILPVNVSPDFPYYLAKINYNNTSQMMAIRGFDKAYLYDLANRRLLPALKPRFSGERYASDAQSGMIQRLELWENYLIGAAQDMGVFVYDLTDKQTPKAIIPFAEYEISETDFGSLFLVNSTDAGSQMIIPSFDINTQEFAVNPLLAHPKKLNTTNISASARNNRFLVIREDNETRTPIAIDLQKRQIVPLPTDVAGRQTQQILQWMRENSGN